MWELINAGGWVMAPIIACSILAVAIVAERLWVLRGTRVAPAHLVPEVWRLHTLRGLDTVALRRLRAGSPLGRVVAAGITHAHHPRAEMLERIEEVGRIEAMGLERYLNTLGTIAAITPLLGLLGTVIGMIDVFSTIDATGLGDNRALAGGIGEALITTGAGLTVAIPAVVAHRYLRGRVNRLIVGIEREALKLADVISRNPTVGGNA
ncbi:MotA/TolQ/ExbB proton channel family protein [Spiribacter onubensis]|uniref:MotA/TolQ/ExbB proton channel family protein n=1 Tax=Spiribacter onubensis TaxID=3122420 RepID=A0ABV3SA56_9GAMM